MGQDRHDRTGQNKTELASIFLVQMFSYFVCTMHNRFLPFLLFIAKIVLVCSIVKFCFPNANSLSILVSGLFIRLLNIYFRPLRMTV